MRPSRSSTTRVTRPSARSRSWVARTTMAPSDGDPLQPIGDDPDGAVVEAGERFVEQHETRSVQQRALEREALPHPAGEPGHVVVGPVGQAGGLRAPRRRGRRRRRRTARRKTPGSDAPTARDTGGARARAGRSCARSAGPSAAARRGPRSALPRCSATPAWPPSPSGSICRPRWVRADRRSHRDAPRN